MSNENHLNESVMRELLERLPCDVDKWINEDSKYEAFWMDFAHVEQFARAKTMTNLPLKPKQISYLAYEHGILLSINNPEFGSITARVRVLFGISMTEHQQLMQYLVPSDGTATLNPLDIRYRCSLMLTPEVWASKSPDFIERQLWVIEQSVILENDRFTRSCLCLIAELRKRTGTPMPPLPMGDGQEKLSASESSDPLSEGNGLWEQNLVGVHTIFLVVSLLRILNHIAGKSKEWFADYYLNLFFCAPLWSCIADISTDDFLHEDHQFYVGLLTNHFPLPFDTMAVFAASRVYYHALQALKDGALGVLPESALLTIQRLLSDFGDYFSSPAEIARCKHLKSPRPTLREFLIRRIVTAEFRDQLIITLRDYRKYLPLKGLLPIVSTLMHVSTFVQPPSTSKQPADPFMPGLIRWCVLSASRRQAARMLPARYRTHTFSDPKNPQQHELEKEQEDIYKYMKQLAVCLRSMRNELPIEAEHFAPTWDNKAVSEWAHMTEKDHMSMVLRGLHAEIGTHFHAIAEPPSSGGPWRYVTEIPPGFGLVATEAVAFEQQVCKNIRLSGVHAGGERGSFFSILQKKLNVAMVVRFEALDKELVRSTFGKTTLWEPVNPENNLLHSQGVMDLWHFIFEAQEIMVSFGIPLMLFSEAFLGFVLTMTFRFKYLCQRDFPVMTKFTLARKAPDIYARATKESIFSVPEVVKERKEFSLAEKFDKLVPKTPLSSVRDRPNKTHDINDLVVRMRSITFFLQQIQELASRFQPIDDAVQSTDVKSIRCGDATNLAGSRALYGEKVWQQWLEYRRRAEELMAEVGKTVVWYFATIVVYVEFDYVFDALYCKPGKTKKIKALNGQTVEQDVKSITLTEVLAKEAPGLRALITLLRPAGGRTLDTCDGYFGPDGFSSKCAHALVASFTQAWMMVVLDRLLKERPVDSDVIIRDIDALQVFANELTNTVPQLGEGVQAVQAVMAQGWSPAKLRVWASNVLTKQKNGKKSKKSKKKKTLFCGAGVSSPTSRDGSVNSLSAEGPQSPASSPRTRKSSPARTEKLGPKDKAADLFTRFKNKLKS